MRMINMNISTDKLLVRLRNQIDLMQKSSPSSFHGKLTTFWKLIYDCPPFSEIVVFLMSKNPHLVQEANKFINRSITAPEERVFYCNEYEGHITLCIAFIKLAIENNSSEDKRTFYTNLMLGYSCSNNHDEAVAVFINEFVNPLFQYIEERLQDSANILSILIRYKRRCEWFYREQLYKMCKAGGEKLLVKNLYEYLFDQGVEFNIEPWSVSGEADIVASQSGDEKFIADAKIFNPEESKGKTYLACGFNQVYTYTNDYNQPFGYIVIYKTCDEDLDLQLSGQTLTVPFVEYNNKLIHLITIDIFPHTTSASKRGKLKKTRITKDDLISQVV
jgi:hypothetical protein